MEEVRELRSMIESERVRSSTLFKRLSVSESTHVNKLLAYTLRRAAAAADSNAEHVGSAKTDDQLSKVKEERMAGTGLTGALSTSIIKEEPEEMPPPPPSYPPPSYVDQMLKGTSPYTQQGPGFDDDNLEDLRDHIRVLQSKNRVLQNRVTNLVIIPCTPPTCPHAHMPTHTHTPFASRA